MINNGFQMLSLDKPEHMGAILAVKESFGFNTKADIKRLKMILARLGLNLQAINCGLLHNTPAAMLVVTPK